MFYDETVVAERREFDRCGLVPVLGGSSIDNSVIEARAKFVADGHLDEFNRQRAVQGLEPVLVTSISHDSIVAVLARAEAARKAAEELAAATLVAASAPALVAGLDEEVEEGVLVLEEEEKGVQLIEEPVVVVVAQAAVVTVASTEQQPAPASRPTAQDAMKAFAAKIVKDPVRTSNGGGSKPPPAPPKKEGPSHEECRCTVCPIKHVIRLVDAFVPPLIPVQAKLKIGDRDPTREELISVAMCREAGRCSGLNYYPLLEVIAVLKDKAEVESQKNIDDLIEMGGRIGNTLREAKIAGRTAPDAPKRKEPPKPVQQPAVRKDDQQVQPAKPSNGHKQVGFEGLDAAFAKARAVTPGMGVEDKKGSKSKAERKQAKGKGAGKKK